MLLELIAEAEGVVSPEVRRRLDLDFRTHIIGHCRPFGPSRGVCTVYHDSAPSISLFHHLG